MARRSRLTAWGPSIPSRCWKGARSSGDIHAEAATVVRNCGSGSRLGHWAGSRAVRAVPAAARTTSSGAGATVAKKARKRASPISICEGTEAGFQCHLTARFRASVTLSPTETRQVESDLRTRLDFIYAVSQAMNYLDQMRSLDWATLDCKRPEAAPVSEEKKAERESAAREKMLRELERRRARQQHDADKLGSPYESRPSIAPNASGRDLHRIAAAVAVRASAVVRAQVSVLRLQFLRSARTACRASNTSRRCCVICAASCRRCRAGQRADSVHRRRHAEPVLGSCDRALAPRHCGGAQHSRAMRRSRSKQTRAR